MMRLVAVYFTADLLQTGVMAAYVVAIRVSGVRLRQLLRWRWGNAIESFVCDDHPFFRVAFVITDYPDDPSVAGTAMYTLGRLIGAFKQGTMDIHAEIRNAFAVFNDRSALPVIWTPLPLPNVLYRPMGYNITANEQGSR